jgi:crossover junction endodeoxyribonuclease RuvC
MRILGIDPGLAIVGWAVLDSVKGQVYPVAYGAIKTPAHTKVEERLSTIKSDLETIIEKYHPDEMAVEEIFFNTNITTGISVSEARGVILCTAYDKGLKISEYTPLQVKQAVVGYGRADKMQVQKMVKTILKVDSLPKLDDITDSMAIAICHAHSAKFAEKL